MSSKSVDRVGGRFPDCASEGDGAAIQVESPFDKVKRIVLFTLRSAELAGRHNSSPRPRSKTSPMPSRKDGATHPSSDSLGRDYRLPFALSPVQA